MPKISEQALTFGVALRGVNILARLSCFLFVKKHFKLTHYPFFRTVDGISWLLYNYGSN